MFSNNQDAYDWVYASAEKLRHNGEIEWASILERSVSDGGGTGGEVLNRVRFFLVKLNETQIPDELGFSKELAQALMELESALGPMA